MSIGAGFEIRIAVIDVSSAFVYIHAGLASSLKTGKTFREAQRANSVFVSRACWVNCESGASSLRSSAEFIVDNGAMRVISFSCLRFCWEPSALCFAAAIERSTAHSIWASELVSSEVILSRTTESVGCLPFSFDL